MPLMDTLMTPRIDAKIRRRLLANNVLKDKYPDFKDIIRERFKSRIKQNRRALFQQMRSSRNNCSGVQNVLCEYLHNEMDVISYSDEISNETSVNNFNIDHELEAMKQIEIELLEEQLNWVMEEYSKEEKCLEEVASRSVFCPICQRGFLYKNHNQTVILCSFCSTQLLSAISLQELHSIISEKVNVHSNDCYSTPQFSIINEPNSSGLFMICHTCSSFDVLC